MRFQNFLETLNKWFNCKTILFLHPIKPKSLNTKWNWDFIAYTKANNF